MGARSFIKNIKEGKIGAAVVDGLGVILDAAATVVPYVPGGVSAGIKAVRGVDKVVDAIDNAGDAAKTIDNAKGGAKAFGGKLSTESVTSKEAFGKAKEANGIPRSQQPDRTIKPNTPEGKEAGLDSRNVKQYEFTNSKGEKVTIRQDKPTTYPDGGQQGKHYNAGNKTGKELKQHHNYNQ